MMMMMQTMINTAMMKMMIWVITFIAISTEPISSHNYLRSRRIRPQYFSVHRVYAPLLTMTSTEPGVICMLWYCISLMISGFTAHLGARGWLGLNQRSSVWCECQNNINFCGAPCRQVSDHRRWQAGNESRHKTSSLNSSWNYEKCHCKAHKALKARYQICLSVLEEATQWQSL